MEILATFQDDQYPAQEILQRRFTVRCLLRDERGRFIFNRIRGKDRFGLRNHLETIGGGIEPNESHEGALRRECREEAGCTIQDIRPLGIIVDRYHLLHRETVSAFYSARVDQWLKARALTVQEQRFCMTLEFYSFEEALKMLNPEGKNQVALLIARRDYAALMQLKNIR